MSKLRIAIAGVIASAICALIGMHVGVARCDRAWVQLRDLRSEADNDMLLEAYSIIDNANWAVQPPGWQQRARNWRILMSIRP